MKRTVAILAACSLVAACFSGCSLLPKEEELLPPKLASAAEVTYMTQAVEKGDITVSVSGRGYFRSFKSETLSFSVDGVLYSKDVKFNQKVKKGDVIGTLQAADQYYLDLANKKKEVNNYQIEMESLKEEAEGTGGNVALLALQLKQEQYNLTVVQGGGTLSDGTTLEAQQLKVQIAQASYDNALAKAKNSYEIAQYNYKLAVEEMDSVQKKYDACFLKAPFSGICVWVTTTAVGSSISANGDYAKIAPANDIVLAYSSPDDASAYLKMGTELTVTYEGSNYTGRIIQTPETQTDSTAYGVKYMYFIDVDGLDMSNAGLLDTAGEINLILQESRDTIVIDSYLITTENDVMTVAVLENGLPIQKVVTTGLSNSTQTEILTGLSVGDLLIVG